MISVHSDYKAPDMTYSKIFTEKQILFIMSQVEAKFFLPEEKGMHTNMLMDDLVPELLLLIFMKEYHYSREDALQQITDQDDKRELFNNSSEKF